MSDFFKIDSRLLELAGKAEGKTINLVVRQLLAK